MLGFLKSLQTVFAKVMTELPEGVKLVTDFLWKVRWFLLTAWLGWLAFNVVTVMLPYLMWTFLLKSIFGAFLPFLS
jgi:hypothetical protein